MKSKSLLQVFLSLRKITGICVDVQKSRHKLHVEVDFLGQRKRSRTLPFAGFLYLKEDMYFEKSFDDGVTMDELETSLVDERLRIELVETIADNNISIIGRYECSGVDTVFEGRTATRIGSELSAVMVPAFTDENRISKQPIMLYSVTAGWFPGPLSSMERPEMDMNVHASTDMPHYKRDRADKVLNGDNVMASSLPTKQRIIDTVDGPEAIRLSNDMGAQNEPLVQNVDAEEDVKQFAYDDTLINTAGGAVDDSVTSASSPGRSPSAIDTPLSDRKAEPPPVLDLYDVQQSYSSPHHLGPALRVEVEDVSHPVDTDSANQKNEVKPRRKRTESQLGRTRYRAGNTLHESFPNAADSGFGGPPAGYTFDRAGKNETKFSSRPPRSRQPPPSFLFEHRTRADCSGCKQELIENLPDNLKSLHSTLSKSAKTTTATKSKSRKRGRESESQQDKFEGKLREDLLVATNLRIDSLIRKYKPKKARQSGSRRKKLLDHIEEPKNEYDSLYHSRTSKTQRQPPPPVSTAIPSAVLTQERPPTRSRISSLNVSDGGYGGVTVTAIDDIEKSVKDGKYMSARDEFEEQMRNAQSQTWRKSRRTIARIHGIPPGHTPPAIPPPSRIPDVANHPYTSYGDYLAGFGNPSWAPTAAGEMRYI